MLSIPSFMLLAKVMRLYKDNASNSAYFRLKFCVLTDMLNELVSRRIVAARKSKNLTQNEAAARALMSKSTLQRIEQQKQTITMDHIEHMADGWEMDYSQLLPFTVFNVDSAVSSSVGNGNTNTFHVPPEEMKAMFESVIREKDNSISLLREMNAQLQKLMERA